MNLRKPYPKRAHLQPKPGTAWAAFWYEKVDKWLNCVIIAGWTCNNRKRTPLLTFIPRSHPVANSCRYCWWPSAGCLGFRFKFHVSISTFFRKWCFPAYQLIVRHHHSLRRELLVIGDAGMAVCNKNIKVGFQSAVCHLCQRALVSLLRKCWRPERNGLYLGLWKTQQSISSNFSFLRLYV